MTAMRVMAGQRVLHQSSQMGFRTMNMAARPLMGAMGTSTPQRAFSLPDHLVMEMPNLSPTMEKGNIKQWHKQVGDEIAPGDALASIETDKAVVDFEMQEEGFVAKLLFEEGAKDVPLGQAVAIIVENKDDIAAFANYTGSESAQPAAAAAPAAPAAPAQ